jgi:ribosome recycling factor
MNKSHKSTDQLALPDVLLKKFETEMIDVIQAIEDAMLPFLRLATGRNIPDLLQGLIIDRIKKTTLREKADVTSHPENHALKIHVHDRKNIADIMDALRLSEFEASVNQEDKQVLVVSFPLMTSDRRQKLMTLAEQKANAAAESWRNRRMEMMTKSKTLPSKNETERFQKAVEKIFDQGKDKIKQTITKILMNISKN